MKAKVIYFLIFLVCWFFIFYGLNQFIVKKLSYKIEKRYLQFRFFLSAMIVSLVIGNTSTSSYSLMFVDKIINTSTFSNILNRILPNRSYELLYMVLCILGMNLIYVLAFIVVLAVTRLIFRRTTKYIDYERCLGTDRIIHAPWYIVNKLYTEKDGKYTLTNKGFTLGLWVKGMKKSVLLIWIAEFALLYYSVLWGKDEWNDKYLLIVKTVYLIPMIAFLLIEQIQIFLEAPENAEVGTFGSATIREKLIGDIHTLTNSYATTFQGSKALLYLETGKKGGEQNGYTGNDIGNQQQEDCSQPGILSAISNQLRSADVHQIPAYQNAVVSLINGNNIIVRDYFDGEFLIYLCAYLNYFLSQGKSVLFLCSQNDDVKMVKNALKNVMQRLNNLDSVWKIATMEELHPTDHTSALICTYTNFLNSKPSSDYRQFANDLAFTVIVDSNSFLQQDNIRIGFIFSKLNSLNSDQQYAFLADADNSSVKDRIAMFKTTSSVYKNDFRHPDTDIMIWCGESSYKLQSMLGIGDTLSPYMGAALPLALVAVKQDLPKINLISTPSHADKYYLGSARTENENGIIKYLESSEYNLQSIVRDDPAEASDASELKMMIIYDTDYNIFNALWKWMKYGGSMGTLIHVISPFYMMREYFAANFQSRDMLQHNNEFTALTLKNTSTKHSRLAAMLTELADRGMTESELMDTAREYDWNYTNVAGILQDALLTVLPPNEVYNIYEHFYFEPYNRFVDGNPSQYVNDTMVKLTSESVIRKQKEQVTLAQMVCNKEQKKQLPILAGNLSNYYLPAQLAVIAGEFYQVTSLGKGIIYMSNATPSEVPDYYPVSEFYLQDYHVVDYCTDFKLVDINICEATAIRTVYGYAACQYGNDLYDSANFSFHQFHDANGRGLSMETKHTAILEVNIRKEIFSSNEMAKKAITLLCVVLSDMFKTLFPDTWQNLFAIPGDSPEQNVVSHILDNADMLNFDDAVGALIPSISIRYHKSDDTDLQQEIDDKENNFVSFYIVELSCVEYGMVQSIREKFEDVLKKVLKYLNWYVASNNAEEVESDNYGAIFRGSYLHFGSSAYPTIFAPDELISILKKILRTNEEAPEIKPIPIDRIHTQGNSKFFCSFCNKEIAYGWELDDGRVMCLHCHDHQKTQRDEIQSLFIDTRNALEEYYIGTKFSKDIHVAFQSADAIRKATNGMDNGRIVGFYNHSKKQLWIEARGPSVAMTSTIIHELTHSWQHDNLPLKELEKTFPKNTATKQLTLVLEGHAVYVELEAMRERGEKTYAERLRKEYMNREDVYGYGYNFVSGYIQGKIIQGSHVTPFVAMQELVQEVIRKEIIVPCPENT